MRMNELARRYYAKRKAEKIEKAMELLVKGYSVDYTIDQLQELYDGELDDDFINLIKRLCTDIGFDC